MSDRARRSLVVLTGDSEAAEPPARALAASLMHLGVDAPMSGGAT